MTYIRSYFANKSTNHSIIINKFRSIHVNQLNIWHSFLHMVYDNVHSLFFSIHLNERVPILRPTAVAVYNKYIGDVNTSDQMLGTSSVHHKT